MIYFTNLWDFDTNPSILKNQNDWMYVQNKNGKILWEKKMGYDISNRIYASYPAVAQKLVDINNDGINEILLTTENRTHNDTTYPTGRVVCYNATGALIWDYYFRDSISSYELNHSLEYKSRIIDTITIDNEKAIALLQKIIYIQQQYIFYD